jgi:hypothetical protein
VGRLVTGEGGGGGIPLSAEMWAAEWSAWVGRCGLRS